MARFVVDLGDIEMNKDQEMALSGAIQKVAMAHLAQIAVEKPFVSHFPREWYGYILRREIGGLIDAEKTLAKSFFGA